LQVLFDSNGLGESGALGPYFAKKDAIPLEKESVLD
jgi:hypothetical protein